MGADDWVEEGGDESEYAKDVLKGDFDTIPVIDVSGIFSKDVEKRKAVAVCIRDACMRVGFFYIENHGIAEDVVGGAFQWAKKFFALPFEEKMKVYIDNAPNFRGYTPLHGSGRPGPDGKGNNNEAFDWGHGFTLNDDPNEQFTDLHMRGDNVWPQSLPGFEEHISAYYRRLREFGRVLTRNIALSLGLSEDFFASVTTHPGCSAVLAHYPPQKVGDTGRGLDAHTDAEFLTVLAPGAVRALEVANRDGQWISAPPRQNCFVVNVGDQLQTMTNGLYVSTRHRVMNYSREERYSIPFFFSTNWETVIEPIPSLFHKDHETTRTAVTAGKMYKDMMIALHRVSASNPELLKYRTTVQCA